MQIYYYVLIDSFWGFPGLIDSPTRYATLLWGITAQTSYVEGWWHQNWANTSPDGQVKSVKTEIFRKTLRHRKCATWNFFGTGTGGTATYSAFRISIWNGGAKFFWDCFGCSKLGNAGRTRVASKIRVVLQLTFWPQFSKLSLAMESAVFHIYQITTDSMARLNSENCRQKVNCNTA